MKFKTTRKAVVSMFPRLYRVGYCDLQCLLSFEHPVAYTSGVYGWNFDLYNVGGVGITTGYRNMAGKNIPVELIEKYEGAARAIMNDYSLNYDDRKAAVTSLLDEFTGKLLEV